MRVVFLAAGAGGMICGSCLRDNRLAATLKEQGRDVVLMPLYTPLRTDEQDVSENLVLFGGINVYLDQKSSLFQKAPQILHRLLDSPGLIRRIAGSARANPEKLGELTLSVLRGEGGRQRGELKRAVRAVQKLRPAAVVLPNLLLSSFAGPLRRSLGVPIACTLSGEDLFVDQMTEHHRTRAISLIREHIEQIDAFIGVTKYYAAHCVEYFGVPRERLHAIPLGVRVADFDIAAPSTEPFTVGYLARIAPEKGLLNLVNAIGCAREAGVRMLLRAAGHLADRAYLRRVLARVEELGIQADFEFAGELSREEKIRFLSGLHAFSVPTDYAEAKGISILEAMAAGVPVVQPRHGAFVELIENSRGGILYEPGEPAALARSLLQIFENPSLRQAMGAAGRDAAKRFYSDHVMAAATWELLSGLCSRPPGSA